MGAMVAPSLPNNSEKFKEELQDKLYRQIDDTRLVTEEGLKLVKDWLEKELAEEDFDKGQGRKGSVGDKKETNSVKKDKVLINSEEAKYYR